jgi:hypothetical protein
LLAPGQLAALGAAALFAGRRGPDAARRSVLLMPPVWLLTWWATGAADRSFGVGAASTTFGAGAASCAMLAAGLLLAADLRLGSRFTPEAAALIAAGAGAGYDGALTPANAAGAVVVLFVILALVASISLPVRRGTAIIMLRVAGSWTAALGLLLIGWWVRGRAA